MLQYLDYEISVRLPSVLLEMGQFCIYMLIRAVFLLFQSDKALRGSF